MGFKCSDENCNSFQQNLIKINMKDVKDMHRGMIKELLQYHMTLLEKKYKCPTPYLLCNNLK